MSFYRGGSGDTTHAPPRRVKGLGGGGGCCGRFFFCLGVCFLFFKFWVFLGYGVGGGGGGGWALRRSDFSRGTSLSRRVAPLESLIPLRAIKDMDAPQGQWRHKIGK